MNPPEDIVTVFLIEYLELVRRSIRRVLEREEDLVIVGEASTLDEAVSSSKRLRPRVTLLAADLPEQRPATIVQRLREADPEARIILLAGTPVGGDLLRAVESGARGCLTYTATLAELAEAIRRVASGETVIDQPALTALFEHLARRTSGVDDPTAAIERLTAQERRVLSLLAQGASRNDIAAELHISPQTVRTHAQRLLSKLGVHSRLEAVAFVNRNQLLDELESMR